MKTQNLYLLRLAKDYYSLISISLLDEPDETNHLGLAKDLHRTMKQPSTQSTQSRYISSNCVFIATTDRYSSLHKLDVKKMQALFGGSDEDVLHVKYVKKELVVVKVKNKTDMQKLKESHKLLIDARFSCKKATDAAFEVLKYKIEQAHSIEQQITAVEKAIFDLTPKSKRINNPKK
jgi:hypothetical protein